MICVKCGEPFESNNRTVEVCWECTQEHRKSAGFLSTNVTEEIAQLALNRAQREVDAIQAYIEGKSNQEIAEILEIEKASAAAFLSRKFSNAQKPFGFRKVATSKKIIIKSVEEFPLNLVRAIYYGEIPEALALDLVRSVEYTLKTLTPREEDVLRLMYRDLYSLEDVGAEFNVTRERIRQIEAKALRKLRHPSRRKFFEKDIDVIKAEEEALHTQISAEIKMQVAKIKTECESSSIIKESEKTVTEKAEAQDELLRRLQDIRVEDLTLSVRAHNCLFRKGISSVPDIIMLGEQGLLKIRNLGMNTVREIRGQLDLIGATLPLYGIEQKYETWQ